jgi:hypothetical protein
LGERQSQRQDQDQSPRLPVGDYLHFYLLCLVRHARRVPGNMPILLNIESGTLTHDERRRAPHRLPSCGFPDFCLVQHGQGMDGHMQRERR